jgi:hypothetical protein
MGSGKTTGTNGLMRPLTPQPPYPPCVLCRYEPGAVYRPHIDGAWPGSGLTDDLQYKYDFFGDRWSRLTFLIYLNGQSAPGEAEEGAEEEEGEEGVDDWASGFDGGCTTFFLPSAQPGWIDATAVVPAAGCALVFPHGEAAGSLLHEGSAVTRGAKFVIRTEVLYRTDHAAATANMPVAAADGS